MRTIEINAADTEAFVNHNEAHTDTVQKALAYLTTWALTGYGHVNIFVARDGEMTACYYRNKQAADVNERPGYVLGAIFHEASADYSFHS